MDLGNGQRVGASQKKSIGGEGGGSGSVEEGERVAAKRDNNES